MHPLILKGGTVPARLSAMKEASLLAAYELWIIRFACDIAMHMQRVFELLRFVHAWTNIMHTHTTSSTSKSSTS